MVGCIEVASIWPPRSRGETKYLITMCTIKNPFFSLEILLGTDIIHKLYNFVFVWKVIEVPFLDIFSCWTHALKKNLFKNYFKEIYHFRVNS